MIIQSSNTFLASARAYSSKYQTAQMTENLSSGTGAFVSFFVDGLKQSLLPEAVEEKENTGSEQGEAKEEESMSDLLKRYQNTQSVKSASLNEKLQQINKIRQHAIDYLLEILFGRKNAANYVDQEADFGSGEWNDGVGVSADTMDTTGLNLRTASGVSSQQFRQTTYFHYEENESVSFSAQGKVVTADGREMDINMEVNLSRSFVMDTKSFRDYSIPVYCDPLVIQLDGSLPSVSDMKFFFDLNSDGEEEEISLLGEGNGFLALDKNGDGVINDGSELFGVESGNGFHDLARYDVDRNGWIDEADEIFDKLRIWMKQEDGTDKLITLKEANVGAINLESAETRFAYNNAENNTNALARRTGFFLYEDGATGSLQQLDMAT